MADLEGGWKSFRYKVYRHLPLVCSYFYRCRRKAWDREAMFAHGFAPYPAQKEFLLGWIREPSGRFWEWDAGDGVVGSHARILEKHRGWAGLCAEGRPSASALLRKHRPDAKWWGDTSPQGLMERAAREPVPDLLTVRRKESQAILHRLLSRSFRPRYLVLQARWPDSHQWKKLRTAGYRLENFIHDDEYYQRVDSKL